MNKEKKSKGEKMFGVSLLGIALFGLMCLTGCGGNACETPKCGSEDYSDITVSGCSIPGPGGCLTFGHGCNLACWPQACKISKATEIDDNGDKKDNILMCDSVYYGGGCLGCDQSQKSCYTGCGKIVVDENVGNSKNYSGCFLGKNEAGKYNEKWIGCGGCMDTDGEMGRHMHKIEELEEIK